MREETGWWLATAKGDLEAARVLLRNGQHNLTAFHAQQAAEKSLKAILAEAGRLFRGHACVDLLAELRADGVDLPPRLETAARRLDLHYIQSRYPNGLGGDPTHYYDASIAQEAVRYAEEFLEFVAKRLGAAS